MKNLIAVSLIGLSFAAAGANAQVQTLKAEVNGMVCAFCAQGIEKKLRGLAQTKDIYVNLKQRVVALELKEGQSLDPQKVKDLVKEAGYEVVSIATVNQSAAELKAAGAK
ncbi:MAG: heavy metal-associated domain-containing protein [Pseudomonadota bacterium]